MAERRRLRRGAAAVIAILTAVASLHPAAPAAAYPPPQRCPAGVVALTFDDGPGLNTGAILDVLARYDARATFFVTGLAASEAPWLVRRAADEGHAIANHTWAHESLSRLSDWRILDTVRRLEGYLQQIGIPILPLVRPPFMATSARVRRVLESAGYTHILWTVDPQDWRGWWSGTIERHVVSRLADGAVILFHDGGVGGANTLGALPGILEAIDAGGFCTGTLNGAGAIVLPPDPEATPFAAEIGLLFDAGITQGCGGGGYCPHGPVTRAQMASFLTRSLWHLGLGMTARPAEWLPAEAGVAADDAITRAQAAEMIVRSLGLPPSEGNAFSDDAGSLHEEAIDALAAAGGTAGCGGGAFCPDRLLHRDELAVMLVRVLHLGPSPAGD